jgi:hypothetical protein
MKCTSAGAWTFHTEGSSPTLQATITLDMEFGGEGADITTILGAVTPIPNWYDDDGLRDAFYNGVHGGLAIADLPLPKDGIKVTFTMIELIPDPMAWTATEKARYTPLLRTCTLGLVAAARVGLDSLGHD